MAKDHVMIVVLEAYGGLDEKDKKMAPGVKSLRG